MTSSQNMFSLIVPTFNEAGNIVGFLESAHESLRGWRHEIIIVDDDSPDQTWALVEHFSKNNPWARAIRRRTDRGLSAAVLCGFDEAKGEWLGVMDADRQHDERILPFLLSALNRGAEIAVGSRRVAGGGMGNWPWHRRLSSATATWLAQLALRLPLSDPMSGYFVLQRKVYERCRSRLEPRGFKILLEICAQAYTGSLIEIPYIFKERREGTSKLNSLVIWQYLQTLWRLRRQRGAAAKR